MSRMLAAALLLVFALAVSCDLFGRTVEREHKSCAWEAAVGLIWEEKSLRRCARREVASDSMLSKDGLSGGNAVAVSC